MGLCQNCERFDIQSWAKRGESNKRLFPCFSIIDGANSGCTFCNFLIEAFLSEYPVETKEIKLGTMVDFVAIRNSQPDGMGIANFNVHLKHDDNAKEAILQLCVTAEDGRYLS
jgi:hypothetical protein